MFAEEKRNTVLDLSESTIPSSSNNNTDETDYTNQIKSWFNENYSAASGSTITLAVIFKELKAHFGKARFQVMNIAIKDLKSVLICEIKENMDFDRVEHKLADVASGYAVFHNLAKISNPSEAFGGQRRWNSVFDKGNKWISQNWLKLNYSPAGVTKYHLIHDLFGHFVEDFYLEKINKEKNFKRFKGILLSIAQTPEIATFFLDLEIEADSSGIVFKRIDRKKNPTRRRCDLISSLEAIQQESPSPSPLREPLSPETISSPDTNELDTVEKAVIEKYDSAYDKKRKAATAAILDAQESNHNNDDIPLDRLSKPKPILKRKRIGSSNIDQTSKSILLDRPLEYIAPPRNFPRSPLSEPKSTIETSVIEIISSDEDEPPIKREFLETMADLNGNKGIVQKMKETNFISTLKKTNEQRTKPNFREVLTFTENVPRTESMASNLSNQQNDRMILTSSDWWVSENDIRNTPEIRIKMDNHYFSKTKREEMKTKLSEVRKKTDKAKYEYDKANSDYKDHKFSLNKKDYEREMNARKDAYIKVIHQFLSLSVYTLCISCNTKQNILTPNYIKVVQIKKKILEKRMTIVFMLSNLLSQKYIRLQKFQVTLCSRNLRKLS